jgi:hypothetical protein
VTLTGVESAAAAWTVGWTFLGPWQCRLVIVGGQVAGQPAQSGRSACVRATRGHAASSPFHVPNLLSCRDELRSKRSCVDSEKSTLRRSPRLTDVVIAGPGVTSITTRHRDHRHRPAQLWPSRQRLTGAARVRRELHYHSTEVAPSVGAPRPTGGRWPGYS